MIALVRRFLVFCVRVLIGARSDWRGCAPDTACRIYFANHSSHVDTVAVMSALPWPVRSVTHPVAARDYWGASPLRRAIAEKLLRAILIDRKPELGTDPLLPIEETLRKGRSILIFPEGTRGSGEEIARFRSGLYRLAQHFPNVDLIPIYLDNLQRIMPKGSMLVVPITCTARFGAPLRVAPGEDKDAFLARARDAVVQLGKGSAE